MSEQRAEAALPLQKNQKFPQQNSNSFLSKVPLYSFPNQTARSDALASSLGPSSATGAGEPKRKKQQQRRRRSPILDQIEQGDGSFCCRCITDLWCVFWTLLL